MAGVITLTAFISPFRTDRARVRALFPHDDFFEVYCRCPLEVCESRDVKGFYKRARSGEINQFTRISAPYEEPSTPELVIDTDRLSLDASIDSVLSLLHKRGVIESGRISVGH